MESNSTINELITWLQRMVIAGGIVRIMYCLVAQNFNYEDGQSYKKRAKHVVIFTIITVSIMEIINLVFSYY